MRSRALWCAVLLAAAAVCASAEDVTGKWTAQVPGRGGETRETTFNFKAEGDKLTGSMSGFQGAELPIQDGKIDGDNISFSVTMSFGGNEVKLLFKGKVSGNEIQFTREREGGSRTQQFTAKRAAT